eukprot:TRINITY_DN22_c0_g1_i4.p1 TRINITY_DN22_c0_g1~~TRINITY_DN22_c0_g1_i4.p1  ORF type:complete len:465 (+),score=84.04 TRINITY_DN22_c0_g1_i4:118-1512(+)
MARASCLVILATFWSCSLAVGFGLYRGPAPTSPASFTAYEQWLGQKVIYGLDFMDSSSWTGLEGGSWQLDPWSKWVNASQNRYFVLSIPMLPQDTSSSSYIATLRNAAQGAYNSTWRTLGAKLVSYGLTDRIVLRIGWEFDLGQYSEGGGFSWSAIDDPQAWTQYWRVIVDVLRSYYPFKTMWNGSVGWTPFSKVGGTLSGVCWPGDSYVTYVAVDGYDRSWGNQKTYSLGQMQMGTWNPNTTYTASVTIDYQGALWNSTVNNNIGVEPKNGSSSWKMLVNPAQVIADRQSTWNQYQSNGDIRMQTLNQWVAFAKNHSKPLVIQEWGVWLDPNGGGDNAYYIQKMYEFVQNPQNNIAWESYFEVYAHDGDHHLFSESGTVPLSSSAAMFRSLWGSQSTTKSSTVSKSSSTLSASTSQNSTSGSSMPSSSIGVNVTHSLEQMSGCSILSVSAFSMASWMALWSSL